MNIQIRTATGKIKETVVVRRKITTTSSSGKRIAWAIDCKGQVYKTNNSGRWRAFAGPAPLMLTSLLQRMKKLVDNI